MMVREIKDYFGGNNNDRVTAIPFYPRTVSHVCTIQKISISNWNEMYFPLSTTVVVCIVAKMVLSFETIFIINCTPWESSFSPLPVPPPYSSFASVREECSILFLRNLYTYVVEFGTRFSHDSLLSMRVGSYVWMTLPTGSYRR